jgi:hypothetical protein
MKRWRDEWEPRTAGQVVAVIVNMPDHVVAPVEMTRRLIVALEKSSAAADRWAERLVWLTCVLVALTVVLVVLTGVLLARG